MNEVVDQLLARLNRQLELTRDLGDRLAAIRIRESSPDGAVTAYVDGNGALVDLEFSRGVWDLTALDVERLLVATAAAACRRAFTERAELIEAFNTDIAE